MAGKCIVPVLLLWEAGGEQAPLSGPSSASPLAAPPDAARGAPLEQPAISPQLVATYLNFRFMALTSLGVKGLTSRALTDTGSTCFPSGSARSCKSRCVLTSPRPTAASRPNGPNQKPTVAQLSQLWPLLLATAPVKNADKTPQAARSRRTRNNSMPVYMQAASGCLYKSLQLAHHR